MFVRERKREVACKTFLDTILFKSSVSSGVHPSRALTVITMTSAPRATASDLSTPLSKTTKETQVSIHSIICAQICLQLVRHQQNHDIVIR